MRKVKNKMMCSGSILCRESEMNVLDVVKSIESVKSQLSDSGWTPTEPCWWWLTVLLPRSPQSAPLSAQVWRAEAPWRPAAITRSSVVWTWCWGTSVTSRWKWAASPTPSTPYWSARGTRSPESPRSVSSICSRRWTILPPIIHDIHLSVKVSADNVLDIIVTVASFTSLCTCPRHEGSQYDHGAAHDNEANEVLELFEDLSRSCLKTIDKVTFLCFFLISKVFLCRTQWRYWRMRSSSCSHPRWWSSSCGETLSVSTRRWPSSSPSTSGVSTDAVWISWSQPPGTRCLGH